MKMIKAALASAVLASFSLPVFAQAVIDGSTDVSTSVEVVGGAVVDGAITVNAETSAVTNNAQASVGNLVITDGGGNDASLIGSANDVTGNAGINIAAGTGNAQSNDAALASLEDASNVFASAQTFSQQLSAVNANIALATDNDATVDSALQNATGNVGLNLVAGSGNMQSNQMATASSNGGAATAAIATATGNNEQLVALTLNGTADADLTNIAAVNNSLLMTAGNIGVNVGAGYGNLQHNSMTIASAR